MITPNDYTRPLVMESLANLVKETESLDFAATHNYVIATLGEPKYIATNKPDNSWSIRRRHSYNQSIDYLRDLDTEEKVLAHMETTSPWPISDFPQKTTWTPKEFLLSTLLGPILWSWEDEQAQGSIRRPGRPRIIRTPEEEALAIEAKRIANVQAQARYRATRTSEPVNPEWQAGNDYISKLKSDMQIRNAETKAEIAKAQLFLLSIPKHLPK